MLENTCVASTYTFQRLILPYLAGDGKEIVNCTAFYLLDEKETYNSKEECKTVFEKLYGEEKLVIIQNCIDAIYDLQNKENERLEQTSNLMGNEIAHYFRRT